MNQEGRGLISRGDCLSWQPAVKRNRVIQSMVTRELLQGPTLRTVANDACLGLNAVPVPDRTQDQQQHCNFFLVSIEAANGQEREGRGTGCRLGSEVTGVDAIGNDADRKRVRCFRALLQRFRRRTDIAGMTQNIPA